MAETRILIVEDEPVIAGTIAMYLKNNDYVVSGIAYDATQAKHELKVNTPDAAILDINLGGKEEGIGIAQLIHSSCRIPFLFLTAYGDRETVDRAKTTEPGGYLVKPFEERALIAALQVALFNHTRRNAAIVPGLSFSKINKHLLSQLSEREFEVLQSIYAGMANQQIAERLTVSVNTVKKHINSSYLKLDVASRTTAISRLLELMMK